MNMIRRIILALALMAGIAPAMAQAPSPVPALPDSERRTSYSITGTTCACNVNFALYGDSTDYGNWVEVWLNGTLIPSSSYTITSPSGSLATLPRPITDAVMTFNSVQTGTVQIVGARRPRRTSQFAENRGVAARDLNQAVTDIVAMLRENWDKTNDVTGRAVLAPPGETLAVLASAASRASSGACFDASGNLVSCVSIPSTTFTAGNGIAITGTSPKTITNNIQGSGPITITGTNPLIIGCATCNTTPAVATSVAFLASRADAITADLHSYSVIRTAAYDTNITGGGATFKNIGSSPFFDAFIATGTLTAGGTGYVNATYRGVQLSGGTGVGAIATIVVAGTAVTSVTLTQFGNGYTAGDVLTASNALLGGSGSGFTWTISTITTPTGSFTDSIGTHFQILMPHEGIDARAMGVKFDWNRNSGDGSATDNFTAVQNALYFAAYATDIGDTGSAIGGLVSLPRGSAMICGSNGSKPLIVPYGVTMKGQGNFSSIVKICDAWGTSTNYVELCDSQSHLACFASQMVDLQIFSSVTHDSGVGVAALSAIYSNSCQQQACGLRNVLIYPGSCRRGATFEIGYGGASTIKPFENVEIKGGQNAAHCNGNATAQVIINYGTVQVEISQLNLSGFSSTFNGPRDNGLLISGGFVNINSFYGEQIVTPMTVNIPSSLANGMVTVHNFDAGPGCVWGVALPNANQPGNFLIGGPMAVNSCSSGIVQDGQPAGSNLTTPQVSDKIFNP